MLSNNKNAESSSLSLMLALNISAFGAAADGVSDDTDAFERAIALIESRGGGRLLVGAGVYNIAPINLTSHMELYVLSGATIRGLADEAVWPIIPGKV